MRLIWYIEVPLVLHDVKLETRAGAIMKIGQRNHREPRMLGATKFQGLVAAGLQCPPPIVPWAGKRCFLGLEEIDFVLF